MNATPTRYCGTDNTTAHNHIHTDTQTQTARHKHTPVPCPFHRRYPRPHPRESGKLRLLHALLARLRSEGHRTLVFSQSKKMLDIIQTVLRGRVSRPTTIAPSFAQVQPPAP